MNGRSESPRPKQSADSCLPGVLCSIRFQYSLATILVLAAALTVFYFGGRYVMMQVVRDLATRTALFWLAFFVAVAGLLALVLLFLLHGRLLLNPLVRMTKMVSQIGLDDDATDVPRLEWKGHDEFASLALSVNRMLETISQRSLAVARAEARHRELINCLPVALQVFDSEGRLVSVLKDVEDADSPPGLYLGERPSETVYGVEPVQRFLKELRETMRTGHVSLLQIGVKRPIGASRTMSTRHFELRIVRFDEYFALVMSSDITAQVDERNRLHRIEARANDSEKRESLTNLAAGIAHDMNNVLSVVLNAAEADGAGSDGAPSAMLETIRAAVRRGSGMMNELREYAGESRMAFHRISVRTLLDDVRLLTKGILPQSIIFSCDPSDNAPDVDVDSDQFWKVIFNIVKNAGEAIGPNRPGRIAIGCRRMEMTAEEATKFVSEKTLPSGVGTVFAIRDDGPGIPASFLPKLFDPYVSTKGVRRGLGLATVRTIVEAHGGGIRVVSAEGNGTLFEIYLPESQQAAVSTAKVEPKASSDRREVLVVDDDASILRTVSILLKMMKYIPHVAKDHVEAMAVVRRHADSLRAIILDANLGATDAVRLLGSFRESAPGVQVVVASGSVEEQIRNLFAPHPYDTFLAKPYTATELKSVLG